MQGGYARAGIVNRLFARWSAALGLKQCGMRHVAVGKILTPSWDLSCW